MPRATADQRGLPVGADRPAVLPGQHRLPEAGARLLRPAGAAQGLHGRRLPGLRVARDGRRLHPADRRLPGRCADGDFEAHRPRPGHGGAGRGARRAPSCERALKLKTPLVGINNRNLRTFEVSLETTLDLLPRRAGRPAAGHRVGHRDAATTCRRMRAAGVHAFLVGEAFMRADEPGRGAGRAVPMRRRAARRSWRAADPADWPVAPGWRPLVDDFFASAGGREAAGLSARAAGRGRGDLSAAAAARAGTDAARRRCASSSSGRTRTTAAARPRGWPSRWRRAWRCRRRCATSSRNCSATWARRRRRFRSRAAAWWSWATHGVLLLNTCLTVEEAQPASHAGRGWEVLTDAVIRQVADGRPPGRVHALGRACPEQAGADRRRPPQGADGQPSVAAVGAAAAGAVHRLRAFRPGARLAGAQQADG